MALPEFPQGFTPEYLTESLGGTFLPEGTSRDEGFPVSLWARGLA